MSEPLLVRAARREVVERTPVWFMRQAGRSLPEYRAIREKHAFFEVANTPELCAEVTLQPVRRHDVDAAVMFADIMTPVLGMGVDVRLVEGVGPVINEPVRTLADVERLQVPDPEEAFAPVLEAVRIVRSALRPEQAVVGFCGGPFTVAGYLVEGKPSREFALTKSLMLTEPDVWHALLAKLAATFAAYVGAKVRAGADVIQLFDSWVGALSPAHYRDYVAPYSARVLAAVDVPTIHFGTGTATLLEEMAAAGGDVIGLDWRIPLDRGWELVPDRAVQGNLDPAVLLAPWEVVEREALEVLDRAGGRPGHIFNLGHGVFPSVDPDSLTRLVALVRDRSGSVRRRPTVEFRPLRADEFDGWFVDWSAWYARDLEEHGGLEPRAALDKATRDMASAFPDGFASTGNVLHAIQANGDRVGVIWLAEREERGRTHAFLYSIAIDEHRRGEGLGRAAMIALEDDVRARGLDRLELNVFGGNAVARRLYASLGFAESFVSLGKDL